MLVSYWLKRSALLISFLRIVLAVIISESYDTLLAEALLRPGRMATGPIGCIRTLSYGTVASVYLRRRDA